MPVMILVQPCFDAKSTKVNAWIVSGPTGVLGSANTESGATSKFHDVVAGYVRNGQGVNYQIWGSDGKLHEEGSYSAQGVRTQHMKPSAGRASRGPRAGQTGQVAARTASTPKTRQVAPGDKGGRGRAHTGLHNGGDAYRDFLKKAMARGSSYEDAVKEWNSHTRSMKAPAAHKAPVKPAPAAHKAPVKPAPKTAKVPSAPKAAPKTASAPKKGTIPPMPGSVR